AGRHQGIGTGRGAAVMAAGFQGDVGGGAARPVAGLTQGMHLGMWLTGLGVPAFADDLAALHDDAADPWIGMGGIQPLARQLQGAGHELLVGGAHSFDGSRARRSISSRNSLRSWKRRYTEAKRI